MTRNAVYFRGVGEVVAAEIIEMEVLPELSSTKLQASDSRTNRRPGDSTRSCGNEERSRSVGTSSRSGVGGLR